MRSATTTEPDHNTASEGALLAFVRTQQTRLWRYLRLLGAEAADAEDVIQETFLRVLRERSDEALVDTEPMLRVVARNLLLDRCRAEKRRRLEAWSVDVERWLARRPGMFRDSRIDALRHCLEQLTARARTAVVARHVDGASIENVAEQSDLKLEGARALLRRTRAQLRDCAASYLAAEEAEHE